MPQLVVNGAMLSCSFGLAPSSLTLPPKNRVNSSNQPAANILDNVPMANIMSFGMCTSSANPMVASATSAAMGVLTPQPCIPNTTSPWAPGSPTVMLAGQPALQASCKLSCQWGGMISVSYAGQVTTNSA